MGIHGHPKWLLLIDFIAENMGSSMIFGQNL
jgi:hypothetical protein